MKVGAVGRVGAAARVWLAVVLAAGFVWGIAGQPAAATVRVGDLRIVFDELAARPLRLPDVPPGGDCPRSASGTVAGLRVLNALGDGPAFLSLGEGGQVIFPPRAMADGYYSTRTVWTIAPEVRVPALVRGKQINGPNTVLFSSETMPYGAELHLGSDPGVPLTDGEGNWRFAVSGLSVAGPGCYVLQVDGPYFSETIIFEASLT